ncbi:7609_t:CDS:2 [Scutellospora calospora]|uniref:7609_t:CDS:1 n=1 Tax=Scutellospora calospora TaxID=85575 RepID=A0ACA9JXJ0_9GLOM|nr:7609_t:CDS:2 [Scutellospora calospora]
MEKLEHSETNFFDNIEIITQQLKAQKRENLLFTSLLLLLECEQQLVASQEKRSIDQDPNYDHIYAELQINLYAMDVWVYEIYQFGIIDQEFMPVSIKFKISQITNEIDIDYIINTLIPAVHEEYTKGVNVIKDLKIVIVDIRANRSKKSCSKSEDKCFTGNSIYYKGTGYLNNLYEANNSGLRELISSLDTLCFLNTIEVNEFLNINSEEVVYEVLLED